MRKTLLIVILLTAVVFYSCDRFDNTFTPTAIDTSYTERLDDFSSQLNNSLLNNDLPALLTFYADNYLYYGNTKSDVEQFFASIATQNPDEVNVSINSTDMTGLWFEYHLTATKSSSQLRNDTIIDTTIVEFTLSKDDHYLFIGNGQEEQVSGEKAVLVEVFTARFCPNCPYVEAALYNLKQQLGDRFFYIEYHVQPPYNFGHQDIASFYGVNSQPWGIIQGQSSIRGGSQSESQNQYRSVITSYFDEPAELVFRRFSYEVDDQTIDFNLRLSKLVPQLPANAVFKYALVDKVSSENNLQGQPFRNVTVRKGDLPLTEDMFSIDADTNDNFAPIAVSIPRPDFAFNYPAIVVWVQTVEQIYDPETCKVHNTMQYEIVLSD